MPTFALKGNLVYFAAYKNHIGFYLTPSGIGAFKQELSMYEGAKDSVKFPIEKPLPLDLISKMKLVHEPVVTPWGGDYNVRLEDPDGM